MSEPNRVTAEEVYGKLKSGKALLVCAYEDEEKFKKLQLEGAISFNAFKSKLPSLSKDEEIVFYCGGHQEASAARQAAKYIAVGYTNVKCLAGGVEAWRKAGYQLINAAGINEGENPLAKPLRKEWRQSIPCESSVMEVQKDFRDLLEFKRQQFISDKRALGTKKDLPDLGSLGGGVIAIQTGFIGSRISQN